MKISLAIGLAVALLIGLALPTPAARQEAADDAASARAPAEAAVVHAETAGAEAEPATTEPAEAEPAKSERADPTGKRIVISIDDRRLWLLEGQDTLMSARVAVGRTGSFTYKGETYNWATPRGKRKVLSKQKDRLWTPPDWHYYEKAASRNLEAVKMEEGKKYELSDGTHLEVRDGQVGRVNEFGNFWPWTAGMELIFDDKIFVPPLGTKQRRVPDALGSHALNMGDGYFIHGTWDGNRNSIGSYASHGCVRMYNEDIAKLYDMVGVGTPVYIE